jgi:hypothetical protein
MSSVYDPNTWGLSRQSTAEHETPAVKRQARRGSKKGTRGVKKKKNGVTKKGQEGGEKSRADQDLAGVVHRVIFRLRFARPMDRLANSASLSDDRTLFFMMRSSDSVAAMATAAIFISRSR